MAKSSGKTKGKKPGYLTIFSIGIILIVALVAISQMIDQRAPVEPLSLEAAERTILSDMDVPRARLQEAKAAFDAGEAVFIDVRSRFTYDISHIPGALSIEIPELEEETADLDREGLYITYCT
jgi:hypothetical protein